MWARLLKCSGHSKRRCSCRTESMLVSEVGMEAFSAMLVPREGVGRANVQPQRILLRRGSSCQEWENVLHSGSVLNSLECFAVDSEQILSSRDVMQSIRPWESGVSDPGDKSEAVGNDIKQVQGRLMDCALRI